MGAVARRFSLVFAAVAAAALAACAAPTPTRSPPPASAYVTSLADVQDKVEAISQDSCTTRSAVDAYPNCARFVAEVGNAALATQSAVTGVPGTDQLLGTSARLADEVGQFSRAGCVTTPGVAGPAAQTCGDILGRIQLDLKGLRTQLAAAPHASAASSTPPG